MSGRKNELLFMRKMQYYGAVGNSHIFSIKREGTERERESCVFLSCLPYPSLWSEARPRNALIEKKTVVD
jgi:hypothetical protein